MIRNPLFLCQQHLQIVKRERLRGVLILEQGIGKVAFGLVQTEDLLLDGVGSDEVIDRDVAMLTDTVGAVGGLLFDGRVPPRVEMDDVVGSGEVEAYASRLEGDKEDLRLAMLEALDQLFAFGERRGAVEVEGG